MGKKTKSKDRLDKFYRFAKEQGYRSRAAFKLIQLNKKYGFLENATVLVDLCAAPGGWCQVASKHMPSASIIIGIDLDPIKPIPRVKTFQADITTQRCLDLIRGEIKHMKVDVVLNDGAPNVGASWSMDAYSQIELVLHSLKLATTVLKKGGWFITKIFRSADFMSLMWIFNKFFETVEISKPEASRTQSAEIFVVCQKFKAPDYIDPKFFDPKMVFKNTEGDFLREMNDNNINSIKKVFEGKRRNILRDDAPATLFRKVPLSAFVTADNPYVVFAEFNAIDPKEDWAEPPSDGQPGKKYSDFLPYPADFEDMCKDLKLLSKGQVAALIRWRAKLIQTMKHQRNKQQSAIKKQAEMEIEAEAEGEGEADAEAAGNTPEGDALYRAAKKEEKAKEKAKEKQMYKYVKSKVVSADQIVGQETEHELADFDFMKHQNQIRKGKYKDEEPEEREDKVAEKKKKLASYAEMCDNIEYLYEQKLKKESAKMSAHDDRQIVSDIMSKKIKKKERDPVKVKKADVAPMKTANTAQIDFDKLKQASKWFDNEAFKMVAEQEAKNEAGAPQKVNLPQEKEEGKKTAKGAKLKEDLDVDSSDYDSESSAGEQEYADLEDEQGGPDLSKMNDDDLAEMIVIGKKMLRKKDRREIIDASYGKYNYPEDPADLPKWFADEEKKHMTPIPQVTKEEIQAEKERLRLLKKALPKKVQEAKFRKKKRAVRELKKAESEAKQLFNEENLNVSKAKQISEIYKRAIRKGKEKPKRIVFMKKNFSGAPRRKSGRKYQVVDKRGKKDLRNKKFRSKGHN